MARLLTFVFLVFAVLSVSAQAGEDAADPCLAEDYAEANCAPPTPAQARSPANRFSLQSCVPQTAHAALRAATRNPGMGAPSPRVTACRHLRPLEADERRSSQ